MLDFPFVRRALGAGAVLAAVAAAPPQAFAQTQGFAACAGMVYSTEEDFVSKLGEAYDGNPVISDGDLISLNPATGTATLCARNLQLLQAGGHVEVPNAVGLDAVDVIAAREGVIAFSTELDDPFGLYGHGDILTTNGAVIPNAVLVARHKLRDNIGLDAVHFVGERGAILDAIKRAQAAGRDKLRENPEEYLKILERLKVDIWFSVEGTGDPINKPRPLDGDLLSALGGVVAPQNVLFSPPIPAGIPDRGVDFGQDAVDANRAGNRKTIQFSSEILYRGEPAPFNDGDVLAIGGAVSVAHEALIKTLRPRANFLGLDALSISPIDLTGAPHIDTLCGDAFAAIDFGVDGLWRANAATMAPGDPPRRPCGLHVPVGGTLPLGLTTPTGQITRFRVTYESLDPAAPPLSGGIETKWRLRVPHPVLGLCYWAPGATLSTDPAGWMDAGDFKAAMDGDPAGITGNGSIGCANPHLRLAVWNTKALADPRENDLMRLQLEWETTGGGVTASAFTYNVQLDNILPQMPLYPNNLQVRLNDGSGMQVPACGEAPTGESVFQVWAEFKDPHYWFFTVRVEGGDPPVSHAFASPSGDSWHEYFETPDGPGPVGPLKNTDDGGTLGLGLQHLRNIDMLAGLGDSFKRCCYLLRLRVYDASIRHTFSGFNPSSSLDLNDTVAITTFEAGG